MMKAQIRELDGEPVLIVEGRLAGAFVPELEQCWKNAVAPGARTIAVDLKGVTCVDRSGRDLLEQMSRAGVRFLHAGMAIQDILDQIATTPLKARSGSTGD